MLEDILNTRTDEIPMCFRKSIKSLKKLRKYVVNSLKYDYTNAMVEGKNNKIKVIKRVSYGYRSFRNFKARIMLMERYKIQKGSIHSKLITMDVALLYFIPFHKHYPCLKIPKTPISVGYSFNYLYLVVFTLHHSIRIIIFQ